MEIKTHLGNFQCSCKKQTDSVILIYTQTGIRANYEKLKENHKPTTNGDWYLCCFTCCGKPFFSKDCAPSNPLLATEHVGPFKCDCAHKRGILPLGDPHTTVPLPTSNRPKNYPEYTLSLFNHGNELCSWLCCGESYNCANAPNGVCGNGRKLREAKYILSISRILFFDKNRFEDVPIPIKEFILKFLVKEMDASQFQFVMDFAKDRKSIGTTMNIQQAPFSIPTLSDFGIRIQVVQ